MKEDLTLYLKRGVCPFCTRDGMDDEYPTDAVARIRSGFLDELYSAGFNGSVELSGLTKPGFTLAKETFYKPKDLWAKMTVDIKDKDLYFIGVKVVSYAYFEKEPCWGDGLEMWHDISLEFGVRSPGSGGKVLEYSIDEFI